MSLTYQEILNQPRSWRETQRIVPAQWRQIAASVDVTEQTHFLFVGSGTSFYIAQSAAHTFLETTGRTATAVPASEVFLSARSSVPRRGSVIAFIISRSGTTSEALLAADYLRNQFDHVQTVAVTCNDGSDLRARTDHAVELAHASEQSVVMTQSFTNMLLALQIIAGLIANEDSLLRELSRLPDVVERRFPEIERFTQQLNQDRQQDLFIYLGLGPNQGLAAEGALKLKEMTQVACEAYNPLEFRHGPISIVNERTTVILLAGLRERAFIADVERDLRQSGALVATIAPYPSVHADVSLMLPDDLSDLARGCLYLPAAQLLGYCRAVAMGLDPDRPRNLNQVVVLNAQ